MGTPSRPTFGREGGSTRSCSASRMRWPQSWGWPSSRSWGWTGMEEHTFSTRSSPSWLVPTTPTRGYLGAAGSYPRRDSPQLSLSWWLPLGHCATSAPCTWMTPGYIWRESLPLAGSLCHARGRAEKKRDKAFLAGDLNSSLQMPPPPSFIWKGALGVFQTTLPFAVQSRSLL